MLTGEKRCRDSRNFSRVELGGLGGLILFSPHKGLVFWGRWGSGFRDRSEVVEEPQGAGGGGGGWGAASPDQAEIQVSEESLRDAGKAAGGGARESRRPRGLSCDGSRCRAEAALQARGLTAGRAGGAGAQGRALG